MFLQAIQLCIVCHGVLYAATQQDQQVIEFETVLNPFPLDVKALLLTKTMVALQSQRTVEAQRLLFQCLLAKKNAEEELLTPHMKKELCWACRQGCDVVCQEALQALRQEPWGKKEDDTYDLYTYIITRPDKYVYLLDNPCFYTSINWMGKTRYSDPFFLRLIDLYRVQVECRNPIPLSFMRNVIQYCQQKKLPVLTVENSFTRHNAVDEAIKEQLKGLISLLVELQGIPHWYHPVIPVIRRESNCVYLEPLFKAKIYDPNKILESLAEEQVSPLVYDYDTSVKFLLQWHADLNYRGKKSGKTPLQLSFNNGNKLCCRALLACGARVNDLDEKGRTLLHHAYSRDDDEFIDLLREYGADLAIVDNEGRTPRYYATTRRKAKELFSCCAS